MKKLLALMLAAAMLSLVLTGCTKTKESEEEKGGKTYKIGIIQLVEHQALDAATEGFTKALEEKLGDKVDIDYQNAQNEVNNCSTIVNKFVSGGYDLIMANATPALQAAAAATKDIPIVGTSITDYLSAGVFAEGGSNEGSGNNITGASDLAPLDQQVDLLQEVCPDAKKVGLVYCSAELNSVYQIDVVEGLLKDAGIETARYSFADSNDIQAVVTKAVGECDTLYLPTDNKLADNISIVRNVTVPKKIPVICGEENMCAGGGLATLSISYEEMGYAAGEMAVDILENGADPATMAIKTVSDNITPKYNKKIAEEIGWEIPEGLTAIE
jgi:putative ABC transport system substrate-binding protein